MCANKCQQCVHSQPRSHHLLMTGLDSDDDDDEDIIVDDGDDVRLSHFFFFFKWSWCFVVDELRPTGQRRKKD